jgi:hypothetical protein
MQTMWVTLTWVAGWQTLARKPGRGQKLFPYQLLVLALNASQI